MPARNNPNNNLSEVNVDLPTLIFIAILVSCLLLWKQDDDDLGMPPPLC